MFDMISIGDATEDVFLQLKEASVHCEKGTSNCTICMAFATKIPVERVDKLVGGNAANAAVGGSRLGMESAFFCVLGQDESARLVKRMLKKERVSTKYVQLMKGATTNYSVVINKGPERTILVYHAPRKYRLPKLEMSRWLYYTSMGKGFERLHKGMLSYVKNGNGVKLAKQAKLAFNPGTHQMRKGARFLSPILKATEVMFLNKEETQFFMNTDSSDFKVLLKKLKAAGPRIAVVTDGPNGSYAFDGKDFYYQGIYDVPIIERTGCGDAYAIGFVAALFHGQSWPEAMRWGTLNAASVIQQIGPLAGLATQHFIRSTLKAHPRFMPEKF